MDKTRLIPIQDSQREIDLANMFGLCRGTSRIDIDATDDDGNPFELKTTTKGGVSTARDLGPNHIEKWSSRYWLIARGHNLTEGFIFDRVFFLSKSQMAGWYEKIMSRLQIDIDLSNKVKEIIGDSITEDEKPILERMLKRGMLLNDPNIPWGYIEKNGIEIKLGSIDDNIATLKTLIEQHPITN